MNTSVSPTRVTSGPYRRETLATAIAGLLLALILLAFDRLGAGAPALAELAAWIGALETGELLPALPGDGELVPALVYRVVDLLAGLGDGEPFLMLSCISP